MGTVHEPQRGQQLTAEELAQRRQDWEARIAQFTIWCAAHHKLHHGGEAIDPSLIAH
jgi:hypothetical protein